MVVTVTLNPSIDRDGYIDHFQYDDTLRLHSVTEMAGGKGVNVSRILQRLGIETMSLGLIGGMKGGHFLGLLENEGIPQDFTVISGETRTNHAVLDKQLGKIIKLNEPGPSVSEEEINKLLMDIKKYIKKENIFILSGSLPDGLEPAIYTRIINLLEGKVRSIAMDTESSILKASLEDRKVDFIKPNLFETERLTGQIPITDGNFRKAIWKLKEYAQRPIISAGKYGVYFEDEENRLIQVTPPDIEIKSSVGSGDAFLAGFLSRILKGSPLIDAARFGAACGTATANAGRPCEAIEAEALLDSITSRVC